MLLKQKKSLHQRGISARKALKLFKIRVVDKTELAKLMGRVSQYIQKVFLVAMINMPFCRRSTWSDPKCSRWS